MYVLHDNIVALATLPGKSALNVIRLSGKNTEKIYKKITKKRSGPKANLAHTAYVYNNINGRKVDFALLTYFKSPKSYTGENLLEISTHGGHIIAQQVIEIIIHLGARQAMPGEFTYRAYINGKVDLLQAEAISSIIDSNNSIDSFYQLGMMRGSLTKTILANKKRLLNLLVTTEHELDFLDTEINKTSFSVYRKNLADISEDIEKIIRESVSTEQQKGNIKISIIGAPNAGKSSLFNHIVGNKKSIITNIKGTTRDPIESDIFLEQNYASIVDTAGIRETKNIIEKKGIKKTLEHIKSSQIIIIIDDKNAHKMHKKYKNLFQKKEVVLVHNKADIIQHNNFKNTFKISCKTRVGMNRLLTHLSTVCTKRSDLILKGATFSINARQQSLLKKIHGSIKDAALAFNKTEDLTILIACLYKTKDLYNEMIKPDPKNKIINEIFKGFCVGK